LLLDGVDLSALPPRGKRSECLISREKERVILAEPLDIVVKAAMSCPPEEGSRVIASLCYSKWKKGKQGKKKIKEKKKQLHTGHERLRSKINGPQTRFLHGTLAFHSNVRLSPAYSTCKQK
jgi:hypothetical protein